MASLRKLTGYVNKTDYWGIQRIIRECGANEGDWVALACMFYAQKLITEAKLRQKDLEEANGSREADAKTDTPEVPADSTDRDSAVLAEQKDAVDTNG